MWSPVILIKLTLNLNLKRQSQSPSTQLHLNTLLVRQLFSHSYQCLDNDNDLVVLCLSYPLSRNPTYNFDNNQQPSKERWHYHLRPRVRVRQHRLSCHYLVNLRLCPSPQPDTDMGMRIIISYNPLIAHRPYHPYSNRKIGQARLAMETTRTSNLIRTRTRTPKEDERQVLARVPVLSLQQLPGLDKR